MICKCSEKFAKPIACFLCTLHLTGVVLHACAKEKFVQPHYYGYGNFINKNHRKNTSASHSFLNSQEAVSHKTANSKTFQRNSPEIGGPSQPEMSSFKPAGSDNLVNLFTGDFNYNIPLLDVGGYPVNLFYDGGITMEQEASWVGLGWNINPGTISRNMRGIPDDFDGTDTVVQTQSMKPNISWGLNVTGDVELSGIKTHPKWLNYLDNASFGLSINNYLGPALELGVKGGVTFKVAERTTTEKQKTDTTLFKISTGLHTDINLSSRDGFTLSPSTSLIVSHFRNEKVVSNNLTLATSYT